MKRLLVVLLGLAAALAALTAVPTASSAGTPANSSTRAAQAAPAPITGRLVYDFDDVRPAVGVRIELRSGPGGTLIGATTTDSEGRFSVVRTGPLPAGGSYVRVVGDNWVQGGIVGGNSSPRYVEGTFAYARRYADGTALGRVWALPSFVRGQVVDAATLAPVAGARVNLRRASDNVRVGTVLTTSNGSFRIYPVQGEDFNLQVNGLAVGHELGYRACNAQLVPTIGEACGAPIGYIGRVYADAL